MSRRGRSRYVFGLSRPFLRDGKTRYAKTFGAENLSDILEGLLALQSSRIRRSDISEQDRDLFARCRGVLDALDTSSCQSAGKGVPSPVGERVSGHHARIEKSEMTFGSDPMRFL